MTEYGIVYKIPSAEEYRHTFEFDFEFKILNFLSFSYDYGQRIEGYDYKGPTPYEGVEWQVIPRVCPRGFQEIHDRNRAMSLYLRILTIPSEASLAVSASNIKVFIKGASREGNLFYFKDIENTKYHWGSWGGNGVQHSRQIRYIRDNHETMLPNGDLTLQFKGTVNIQFDPALCKLSSKTTSVSKTTPVSEALTGEDVTREIVKKLLAEGMGSDVVLKARGQEFKCHKWILSLRCEYFRAMFSSGLKESRDGVVDFSQDMDGEQLKDLLDYLYLGMASNLSKTCGVMLKMAEMLDLQDLKSQSEKLLIQQLKMDNAWDLLNLAREQRSKNLQKEALFLLAKIAD